MVDGVLVTCVPVAAVCACPLWYKDILFKILGGITSHNIDLAKSTRQQSYVQIKSGRCRTPREISSYQLHTAPGNCREGSLEYVEITHCTQTQREMDVSGQLPLHALAAFKHVRTLLALER
jgi:hypothetical protein